MNTKTRKLNQQMAADCRRCGGWNVRVISETENPNGWKYNCECKSCNHKFEIFITKK